MRKLSFLLLFLPLSLMAQLSSFQLIVNTPGGIITRGATENIFGDVFVAATLTGGLDGGDLVVMKVINGNISWSKQFVLPGLQEAVDVAAHQNGDITVIGHHASGAFTPSDLLMMRLDVFGNVLWSKVTGSADLDRLNKIDIISGDRLRISGGVAVNGISSPATLIFDGNGNLLSEKYLNTISYASQNFVADEMGDGNLIITGSDRFGLICDSTGFFINNFPAQLGGESASACAGLNGKYVVAYSNGIGAPNGGNIVIGSYVPGAFFPEWLAQLNSSLDEKADAIFFHQNQYILISTISAANGTQTLGITVMDTIGNPISTKRISFPGYDYITINNSRQNSDGSMLLTAMIMNSNFIGNGLLMKISAEGDPGCSPPAYTFNFSQTSSFQASGVFNQSVNLFNIDSAFTSIGIDTSFQTSFSCLVVSDKTQAIQQDKPVYPNPSEGLFTIPEWKKGTAVELWDAQGKLKELRQLGEGLMEVAYETPGLYLLRYTDKQGVIQNRRIILK